MRLSSAISILATFFALLAPISAAAVQMNIRNVNILADPSLSLPITEIARRFSSKYNIAITTAYASSRDQSDNIVAGLEADVFITARPHTLEKLKTQGLIDVYSQKEVTRNRLSMVTYAHNEMQLILIPKLPIHSMFESVDPECSFIIGDPSYQTSGYFALKALRSYKMAGNLEPNMLFVRSPIDTHRTITQKGGYGIVYTSEATRNPALKTLGTFPESAHSPIVYSGVAVAGENMEAARKFLQYLSEEEAQAIFVKHGFESMLSYPSDASGHLARGSTVKGSTSPL